MAARSATPDFGDDGVDEVDGRFPEPVAEPRPDADDPPALTSGFFGRRKAVPPIGEAKTPTSTKSRTSQAEEKLEELGYWPGEWVCTDCGYIYEPGNEPPFEELRQRWKCPQCAGPRRRFVKKAGDMRARKSKRRGAG